MNIEQTFAAEVFNAAGDAAVCRKHGRSYSVSDAVHAALVTLWKCGRDMGFSRSQLDGIANRYVIWGANDQPSPRVFAGNIVRFRRS